MVLPEEEREIKEDAVRNESFEREHSQGCYVYQGFFLIRYSSVYLIREIETL